MHISRGLFVISQHSHQHTAHSHIPACLALLCLRLHFTPLSTLLLSTVATSITKQHDVRPRWSPRDIQLSYIRLSHDYYARPKGSVDLLTSEWNCELHPPRGTNRNFLRTSILELYAWTGQTDGMPCVMLPPVKRPHSIQRRSPSTTLSCPPVTQWSRSKPQYRSDQSDLTSFFYSSEQNAHDFFRPVS